MFPFGDLLDFSGYTFHRPFYERQGYSVKETDEGLVILFNALGVSKEDIQLDVKSTAGNKQMISIRGKTHDDDFSDDFEAKIDFILAKQINSIEWDVQNGFMKIWIKFEEPIKPNVKIVRK